MAEELNIIQVDSPGEAEWGAVGGGIDQYNRENAGPENAKRICFVLRNAQDKIVGGVIGIVYWNWFSIDLMFIQEPFRGLGHGAQLLNLAEEEAKKMGVKHVHLDTFSFQAPDFYRKHGYLIFGELEHCPTGHKRIYMTKEL